MKPSFHPEGPCDQAPSGAERPLYVLARLAEQGQPVSVTALAGITGLAVSTLYRQLALLKNWGFVQEVDAAYMPGPRCLQLAWGFDQSSWLVHEALPEMQNLSAATGETVGLMVPVDEQVVCLEMVESRQLLRCTFVKGRGLSLYHGASAKALLAFLPQPQRERIVQAAMRHKPPVDARQLQGALAHIRTQGFAISTGEVDEGVWGVSVPIFPTTDRLLGAITLMAPVGRSQPHQQQWIERTRKSAKRIEARLRSLH